MNKNLTLAVAVLCLIDGACLRSEGVDSSGNDQASMLPFLMPSDFTDLDLVAWRVEQGKPDDNNPLLEPEMPWDEGGVFSHGTVLRDPIDGLWKAWQISTPISKPNGPGTWRHDRRLSYLESKDGVRWRRPRLSLIPYGEHKHTNLLMDLWCSYASVNIDPQRAMPYEMFIFRYPGYPGATGRIEGLTLPKGEDKHPYGLYRFRSKDGKNWKAIEGPIKLNTTDSCFLYRQADGTYVAYHKTELPAFPGGLTPYDIADGGLRLIGRRTSTDGTTWSDPTRLVMTPDWRDPADTQFMELCPVKVPGGFAATVTVYHNHTQRIDLQFAASRDGINWWRPDRRAALPNSPLGEYGGGMIWPMSRPLLDGKQMHVYYSGNESLHGDLFNTVNSGPRRLRARGEVVSRQSSSLPNYGALCRATWTADRLWALAPVIGGPYVGTATTGRIKIAGKQLFVNAVIRKNGELRVALLDSSGKVIEGYSKDDCQPISGDHHATVLTWKAGNTMPNEASRVRFYLRRTFLYGFHARKDH
ncbi:MAG: hypothetical protein CMJ78_15875 [Planctomycetaceae bacterium]|nr:hypothetical protein [Planctomycetaceae bacterium]